MDIHQLDPCGIWVADNFLGKEKFDKLSYLLSNDWGFKEEASALRPPLISPSEFHYEKSLYPLHEDSSVRTLFEGALQEYLDKTLNSHFSLELDRSSRILAKRFNSQSHYKTHIELPSLFGEYAFVLFMTSEKDGALSFPSLVQWQNGGEGIERSQFEEMEKKLSKEQKVTWSEGVEVLPQENRCVLFSVSAPHKVSHCSGERLIVTGWPFAQIR